jgi:hypothetical protein
MTMDEGVEAGSPEASGLGSEDLRSVLEMIHWLYHFSGVIWFWNERAPR